MNKNVPNCLQTVASSAILRTIPAPPGSTAGPDLEIGNQRGNAGLPCQVGVAKT